MEICELRDSVPYLFIDGTGNLTTLNVHDRDVHVRRSDRGCQCLVAIGHSDHGIRLQVVEHGGKLDEPEACRLCGRHEVFSLEHHVDARRRLEPVVFDGLNGAAVTFEQCRGGDDELELEVGMILNGAKCGPDP